MANTSFKNYRIFYNFLNLLSKKLTKFYYKKLDKPFKIVNKEKGTGYDPVTTSDKAFEKFIRLKISSRFPDHQIIGEEILLQQTAAVTELRVLESSPEAILCNVASQQGGKSFIDHNKRIDVGLILFPDPQEIQETTNQMIAPSSVVNFFLSYIKNYLISYHQDHSRYTAKPHPNPW